MKFHRFVVHSISLFFLTTVGCQQDPTVAPVPQTASTDKPVETANPKNQQPETASLVFTPPNLTVEEIHEGWISLFDGVSLFGWDVPEGEKWYIEDHCLVSDSGAPSLLKTPFSFDNFELRCDFHLETGGNSGVFLRTAADVSDPATDTYELNICDSHDSFSTGSLVARHKAEGIPTVEGEWHTFRVICDGPRIQVWLDDAAIVDFTDNSENARSTGSIGLQMNGGRIAFKNVFVKPVGSVELFDGESLNGWSVVDGSKSHFEVADGAIHVSNGPGFLQTETTHADFMLQIQARTNGDALNSGVFFRAISGTVEAPSHGYEMQIQNGYEDNDRTQPADFGTGAIFRRAAARYIVANDHEWLTATLIAQGSRIASWVNGYQVVNWKDTREPDENPRRGKRLKAGHLSLQGHDPTTSLEFRSVRIHDIASGE